MAIASHQLPLRVAIIGAGIGVQHLDAYLNLPTLFQVSCICDLDAPRAQALAERVPGCAVSAQLDDLLSDPAIDLIDICLPSHLHAPVALQALQVDKHVICEKPLAGNLLQADELARVAASSAGVLMPVFQYRYGVAMTQMLALKRHNLLGKPQVATLETHWNRGADYYAVDWRGTWAGECGGVLVTHAIHSHDLLSVFFGDITAVSAALDTRVNPIETEDTAALILHTASGGLATSSVTLGAATDTTRIRLVYDSITIDSALNPYRPCEGQWTFVCRDADPARQATVDQVVAEAADRHDDTMNGYTGQFKALARHLSGRHESVQSDPPQPLVTVADGVAALELITAAYESARTGKTVHLPVPRHAPISHDLRPDPCSDVSTQ